jgi:CRP-like cAMP-binding protein
MKAADLERHLSPGERVLDRGAIQRELYVVRSGRIRLERGPAFDPQKRGPGEIFGEVSAILGQGSPYEARAEEESTVLALELSLVQELCLESPEFALRLIRHLASELAGAARPPDMTTASRLLADPSARSAELLGRLMPVLLERIQGRSLPAPVDGTLRDLAAAANLSILDAYLTLQDLLNRDLLQLVDDQLSVLEPASLRALIR